MNWLRKLLEKEEPAVLPDFWQRYQRAIAEQSPATMPITEAEFVVFDTETTGLDPDKDKVLSLSAVRVYELQVLVEDSFEFFVQQEVPRDNKGAEVHGILPSEALTGTPEHETLQAFLDFIGGAVLVGHHVAFDVAMVTGMLRRAGINRKLINRSLDTAQLARRLERAAFSGDHHRSSEYSLDALCKRYHLPTVDRHTASGDAFATALLLLKLLSKAQQRGILMLGQLLDK